MTHRDELDRWAALMNLRGIAGLGARETEDEKLIVEYGMIDEFANTVNHFSNTQISNIVAEEPPLPDFSCEVSGQKLHLELTEFVDPSLLKQAKHIVKTPTEPLYNEALGFETSFDWFSELLQTTIEMKNQKYMNRDTQIDVLLIWNEALQVGIEDTARWLKRFEVQGISSITSVYFQSWYHPSYIVRPTWSLKAHPLLGDIKFFQ